MLLLNKNNIKEVIQMKDAVKAVKHAYSVYSKKETLNPLRTIIENKKGNGQVLFMPSHINDLNVGGIKIVSIYPYNQTKGLNTILSSMILLDGETGETKAIIDGTYLTQLRTGAATGVAIELFAKKDSEIGLLIGTGGQATCQLEAMISSNKLSKIFVYSRTESNIDNFINKSSKDIDFNGIEIVKCKNLNEIVPMSDVIVTATTSKEAVFDGSLVKKGTLISAIGAYTLDMHELDFNIVKKADKIFVDSYESILSEAGDLISPLNSNIISESKLQNEIGDVINNKKIGRENEDEIIIFKSVGIGTQDIATAEIIYERAISKSIGLEFNF